MMIIIRLIHVRTDKSFLLTSLVWFKHKIKSTLFNKGNAGQSVMTTKRVFLKFQIELEFGNVAF